MQPSSTSFEGGREMSSYQTGQAARNVSSVSGSHSLLTDAVDTNHSSIEINYNDTGEFYHQQSSTSTSHLGDGNCDGDGNNHSGIVQNSYLPYGSSTAAKKNNINNEGQMTTTTRFYSSSTTIASAGHGNDGAGIGSAAGVPPHPTKTSD